MPIVRAILGSLLLLTACGPTLPPVDAPPRPTTAAVLPDDPQLRRRAIDSLGRRAWAAMTAGEPERLLVDELDLRALLDPAGATRIGARRLEVDSTIGSTRDFPTLLASAEYAGLCVQGARAETAGGVLGLRADGWIFDRMLLIGRRPSGRRIAGWLEGTFLYTDAGFAVLDLERVEEPRWEHSDLELAPCDLAIREDLPERAR